MSAQRTERLLNLLICLADTNRWLTREELRLAVPQYGKCDSDAAFQRMFERDKDDLREMGAPILVGNVTRGFDDVVGYRIDRDEYRLPALTCSNEELNILSVAARLWHGTTMQEPAQRALHKLRAVVPTAQASRHGLSAALGAPAEVFTVLLQAVQRRQRVSFDYPTETGGLTQRLIEPWEVVNAHGQWYVTGHDCDRGERRTFRLSRLVGVPKAIGRPGSAAVPPHRGLPIDASPGLVTQVELLVRHGRAHGVRSNAEVSTTAGEVPPGFDALTLPVAHEGAALRWLMESPHDVVITGPESLRSRWLTACAAVAELHSVDAPSIVRQQVSRDDANAKPPAVAQTKSKESVTQRLCRLLSIASLTQQHPGTDLSTLARHFNVSEADFVKDLELLFVCGTPGHMPDDLIDADWEDGQVYVANADHIADPLRLTTQEAASLVTALSLLAAQGAVDPAMVHIHDTLKALLADAGGLPGVTSVGSPQSEQVQHAADIVRDGIDRRRAVRFTYASTGSSSAMVRTVEPWSLGQRAGVWYLIGWCQERGGERRFRLDRMGHIAITDVALTHPCPDSADTANLIDLTGLPTANVAAPASSQWLEREYGAWLVGEVGDRSVYAVPYRDAEWLTAFIRRGMGQLELLSPASIRAELSRHVTPEVGHNA